MLTTESQGSASLVDSARLYLAGGLSSAIGGLSSVIGGLVTALSSLTGGLVGGALFLAREVAGGLYFLTEGLFYLFSCIVAIVQVCCGRFVTWIFKHFMVKFHS